MAYVLTGQTIQLSGYFTENYKRNLLLGDNITVKFFSLGDSDTNYFIDETLNKVPEISGDDDIDCIKSLSGGQSLKYELNVLAPTPPQISLIADEPISTIGNIPFSFNVMINEAVDYDIPFSINVIVNQLSPFNASYINRITFGALVFQNLAELINYTFILRAGESMLTDKITVFYNNIPNDGIVRNIELIFSLVPRSANESFTPFNTITVQRRNNFVAPITISNLSGQQGQPLISNLSGTIGYPITYTIAPTNTTLTFTQGTTHTLLANIVQSGLYTVTVRDSFNNSDTKTLNIQNTNILSASLVYDNNGNFTVTTQNGGATIRYELLRNGVELAFDSGLITNNNQLFIINLTSIINGNYTVRVTSGGQTAITNIITINNTRPIQGGLMFEVQVRDIALTQFIMSGVQTSNSHNIVVTRLRNGQVTNIPLNFIGNFTTEINLLRCEQYNARFIEGVTNRQSNLVTFETSCDLPDRPPGDNGGGGGGGCFGFGTKITMQNNTVKNIEEVKVGDQILSLDIPSLPKSERFSGYSNWRLNIDNKNFQYRSAIVKDVFFNDYNFYYVLNRVTKVTFEHPFLIERNGILFFVQAKDLKKNDKVYNQSGSFTIINRIERVNIKLKTVNINVEPYDVYFADGFLVHNSDFKEVPLTF